MHFSSKKYKYLLMLVLLQSLLSQASEGTRPPSFMERVTTNWGHALSQPEFVINTIGVLLPAYLVWKNMSGTNLLDTYTPIKSDIKFADVIGQDEAKAALKDVIQALKDPESYKKLGARIPKGILLEGAPGNGKTLLAKAVAGEAGVPFFAITGSAFSAMFYGVGISKVKKLFEVARKNAPSIIFIDEMDGIGARMDIPSPAGLEGNRVIGELLAQMDGIEKNAKPIVVIGATNFRDRIDPALLRSGRFDTSVKVANPLLKDRVKILELYANKIKTTGTIDFHALAEKTDGFAAADLENLVNKAASYAVRRRGELVGKKDFDNALMELKKSSQVIELQNQLSDIVQHSMYL